MIRSRALAPLALAPLALAAALACLAGPARAQSLADDKARLLACVEAAFPEGAPVGAPPPPPARNCLGLLERDCDDRSDCARRESRAWLALAREAGADAGKRGGARNRAAYAAAVKGVEAQARAVCTAAAANSAWGGERVAKGGFKIGLDHPCMRDAIAGQVIFLLGYAYGA